MGKRAGTNAALVDGSLARAKLSISSERTGIGAAVIRTEENQCIGALGR